MPLVAANLTPLALALWWTRPTSAADESTASLLFGGILCAAAGDLTGEVVATSDNEMGRLSAALQQMQAQIQAQRCRSTVRN